ncbi:MAG: magnesium transporter, partial [Rhizobiaceae bacterium]
MSEVDERPPSESPSDLAADIYDEEGVIRGDFVSRVEEAIATSDRDVLRNEVGSLHESEVGDLIEALQPEERRMLVGLMGEDFDFAALTEVDGAIRSDIVDNLPNAQIAQAVQEMDSDDAVYILEDLDQQDRDEILAQLPFTERIRLRRALDYPEETAGRRMQTEFVAVPPFWTVGQTIDYMREDKNLPDSFSQIFVIDPTFRLLGAVDLDRILRSGRTTKIEEVMHETRHAIPATMDQEEAAREFEQYDLLSAAVVDENERLVGVLTIDDVVDVIQEEAEEDLMRMGGVGDEELSDTILRTSRSRVPWLAVNLLTA